MKQRRTRAAQQRELSAHCATEGAAAARQDGLGHVILSVAFGGNAGCGVRLVICDSQFNAGARLFHLQ
jgi:hypothetical protein